MNTLAVNTAVNGITRSMTKMVFRFRRSFLTSILLLGLVSLTSISISQQRIWARSASTDAHISELNEAVQRLLLADELANDDEVTKAGANFDHVMKIKAALPITPRSSSQDVWDSAVKIRGLLVGEKRRDAIDEAVNFRRIIDQQEAHRLLGKETLNAKKFDWSFALGIFGAISCLILLGLSHKSLVFEVGAGAAAMDSSTSELLSLNQRFDDERQRTAILQKRLIEMTTESKNKAAEVSHRSEFLESQVSFLKNSLSTASGKYHALKSTTATLEARVDSLTQGIANISERNSKLKLELATLLEEFEAQVEEREFEAKEHKAILNELSTQKLLFETAEATRTSQLDEMRINQLNFRATIETENTILNWTNKKLTMEIMELKQQSANLKQQLVREESRNRE